MKIAIMILNNLNNELRKKICGERNKGISVENQLYNKYQDGKEDTYKEVINYLEETINELEKEISEGGSNE